MTTNEPGQPTAVYPPADSGVMPQPAGPDARPRSLGWIALITALVGLVLVLVAFVPVVWVGFTLASVGGLLLLVSLVLGIVTLVNRAQGGKGLGIAAIVVSVVGGAAWVGSFFFALVLIGMSTAGGSSGSTPIELPSPQATVQTEDPAPTEAETDATATADEAAFVAAVRPELTAFLVETQPSMTEDLANSLYTDETLVAIGQGFLMGGDTAREAFVSAASSSGDSMTPEQANRFVDIILEGAQQYLAE